MEVILLKSSSLEIERPSVMPVAASVLPENSLSIAPMSSIDPMGLGLDLPFRSTLGASYVLPAIVVKDRVAALKRGESSVSSKSSLSISMNGKSPVRFPGLVVKVRRLVQSSQ